MYVASHTLNILYFKLRITTKNETLLMLMLKQEVKKLFEIIFSYEENNIQASLFL